MCVCVFAPIKYLGWLPAAVSCVLCVLPAAGLHDEQLLGAAALVAVIDSAPSPTHSGGGGRDTEVFRLDLLYGRCFRVLSGSQRMHLSC
eukprot:COSAG01_NODE_5050_length_4524_cov_189.554802_4_plen_89_part_00